MYSRSQAKFSTGRMYKAQIELGMFQYLVILRPFAAEPLAVKQTIKSSLQSIATLDKDIFLFVICNGFMQEY